MNKPLALFFDIDGTLVSFATHQIPESTVSALEKAKARGAKVFISTGRPVCLIDNIGQIEHLVDGFVTINGAHCFVGDRELCCKAVPPDDVRAVTDFANEHRLACIFVGEKGTAILNDQPIVHRIFVHDLNVRNLDFDRPVDDLTARERIMQLSFFLSAEQERQLMPRLGGCVSGRWHPEFTDLTTSGADKGSGMLLVAHAMGIDPSRTIAFGDGGNDLSIIEKAAVGVAMGNASDELKAAADHVTADVDHDGISRALTHLGVI